MKIKHTLLIATLAITAAHAAAQSRQEPAVGSGANKAAATVSKAVPAANAADKGCTSRPKSDWLPVEEMALLAKHRGYKFERVKISYETCYEIYGTNRDGDLVEAYFDPSNAKLMRQNVVVLPKK